MIGFFNKILYFSKVQTDEHGEPFTHSQFYRRSFSRPFSVCAPNVLVFVHRPDAVNGTQTWLAPSHKQSQAINTVLHKHGMEGCNLIAVGQIYH